MADRPYRERRTADELADELAQIIEDGLRIQGKEDAETRRVGSGYIQLHIGPHARYEIKVVKRRG